MLSSANAWSISGWRMRAWRSRPPSARSIADSPDCWHGRSTLVLVGDRPTSPAEHSPRWELLQAPLLSSCWLLEVDSVPSVHFAQFAQWERRWESLCRRWGWRTSSRPHTGNRGLMTRLVVLPQLPRVAWPRRLARGWRYGKFHMAGGGDWSKPTTRSSARPGRPSLRRPPPCVAISYFCTHDRTRRTAGSARRLARHDTTSS